MTTLPLDFDIFLRSGSRIQPLMAASCHGSHAELEVRAHHRREQPGADDVLSLRAKVHREHPGEQVVVDVQPPAICGDSDDVAQVSITSGSPMNPPGWPRWDSSYPAGQSLDGSTGSADSSGTSGVS